MKATTLEVTFRKGKPFAAYLRLYGARARVKRTKEAAPSLLVDFDEDGRALGLEILAFDDATVARINEVLLSIGHAALPAQLTTRRAVSPSRASEIEATMVVSVARQRNRIDERRGAFSAGLRRLERAAPRSPWRALRCGGRTGSRGWGTPAGTQNR